MAKYDSYSLREIKAAMRLAYSNMAELHATYAAYKSGSTALTQAAQTLNSVTANAMSAWQGNAASSAQVATSEVSRYADLSVEACEQLARATHGLTQTTRHQHNQVDGIEEVDTSAMASMSASGMNPAVALYDHHDRVQRAGTNQKQAAAHARALDEASHQYAADMKAADWPSSRRRSTGPPPRTLPPRPTRSTPGDPGVPLPTPPGPNPPPAPVPPGPPRPHDVGGSTTVTAQGFDVPTFPAGVDVGAGAASGALAGAGSTGGLAGPGAGVLGGAGGLLAGGASGAVAGRAGSGRPGVIEDEALRARGRGVGLAGEAAGERGMTGAPMAGGKRSDEDEHRLPDYLEEPEDTWLASDGGVPPVLGED